MTPPPVRVVLVDDQPLAEIAAQLFITPATAKAHVGRLLTKLAARDRVQLVIIAYELGLVSPSR